MGVCERDCDCTPVCAKSKVCDHMRVQSVKLSVLVFIQGGCEFVSRGGILSCGVCMDAVCVCAVQQCVCKAQSVSWLFKSRSVVLSCGTTAQSPRNKDRNSVWSLAPFHPNTCHTQT